MQETHKLSDNLAALKEKIETGLEGLSNSKELYEFRSSYLEGKKSKISELMKEMRNLAPEERAGYGKSVNELKEWAIDRFSKMEEKMKQLELQRRYESEKIDLTLPADETGVGNLHPITLVRNQLIDIFAGMGFEVYEGAEIENDYYNFTALNTPKDHPARDMQDTFYLSPEFLLRTQTSAGQIHVMENKKPPIKILSPGRVFRSDDDATHSPMFHQMEGLVVDKGITLSDLKGMLDLFVKKINDFRVAAVKYKNLLSEASGKENEILLTLSNKMRTIHDEINTKSEYSHDKLVEITRKHYEKLDIK